MEQTPNPSKLAVKKMNLYGGAGTVDVLRDNSDIVRKLSKILIGEGESALILTISGIPGTVNQNASLQHTKFREKPSKSINPEGEHLRNIPSGEAWSISMLSAGHMINLAHASDSLPGGQFAIDTFRTHLRDN